MSNRAPRYIQRSDLSLSMTLSDRAWIRMVVLNADQIGESGRSLRELCQSDKLSIVVLKKCLAILHRLVITIYALLKMFSFNFQCFSESIVPNVKKTISSTPRSMISIGVVLSRPWDLAGGRTCGTQGATTSRTLFLLCALLSSTMRRRDLVFSQVHNVLSAVFLAVSVCFGASVLFP